MIDLRFDRVSKRYLIRQETDDGSRHPLRKLKSFWRSGQEFWALRDVSFEVRQGEALGIIGQNGAGKSTILKLLSNITIPSSGEITINGRLSALIEVGSGFHPELTGRENVYLSGSILGMRRAEITRKLESIIDFAGIRQFIDTPVKRYSSGMFVRLGFSIAAHLEPHILLLDEVLAVGDAAFQSKCLNRVDELRDSGKTIVFISHDLNAVERLCGRVLLLERGQIVADGSPVEVIELYKNSGAKSTTGFQGIKAIREWVDSESAPSDGVVRMRKVRVCTENGETAATFDIRHPVCIEMTYEVLRPGYNLVPNFNIFNQERLHLFNVQEVESQWRRHPRPVGLYASRALIPGNLFAEGSLVVEANISSHIPVTAVHLHQRDAVAFSVIDSFDGDAARGDYTGPLGGVVRPMVKWTTQFQPGEIYPTFVSRRSRNDLMAMRSDVSVVTSTYNGAAFIASNLESIFAQTEPPAEIVVVDDHSSDDTGDLVCRIAAQSPMPIRLIRLRQNSGGPSLPLNLGIEAAESKYIALIDQDDLMRPRRIEVQRKTLDACPQCCIAVGRFSIVGQQEDDMTPMWPVSQLDGLTDHIDEESDFSVIDSETAFKGLLSRNYAGGMSGFCFTKDWFQRLGGFDNTVYTCADLDFLLRATLAGPIAIVNERVFDYRWRTNSLQRKDVRRSQLEGTMVRLRAASKRPEWAGEELNLLRHSALTEANTAVRNGDLHGIQVLGEILSKHKGLQVVRQSINNKTRRLIGLPSR